MVNARLGRVQPSAPSPLARHLLWCSVRTWSRTSMNRWLTSSVRAGGSEIEPSVRKMRRFAREVEKQAPHQRRRACQRSDPTGSRKPPRFPADIYLREMVSRFARGLTSWLSMAFLSTSIPRNNSTAAWRCLVVTMEVWSMLLQAAQQQ